MKTDFRALCAELLEALENAIAFAYREDGAKHISTADAVRNKADIALAQPEPEGPRPTRDEAVAVYTEVMAAHDCQTIGDMAEHFARAVLARWGRPAAPPANGEVAELVARLRDRQSIPLLEERSSIVKPLRRPMMTDYQFVLALIAWSLKHG